MFDSQLSLAGKDKDKREAVAWKYSVKGVLEISQNSQKNTCARVPFSIKLPLLKCSLY